ncbi:hypothetical protein F2Q70_00038799 [Brassica cretica]|uniref:Retrotransposon gag domain-containing protein n=1 Tax=Brassica cretica TaxID=69181 RepID=A0A8S9KBC1_BRACR|nr:hypothetical protein F2Q70_00038799 [Brassica cretica]
MAVDEQNELPKATPREAELQRQLDGIQSQVTELNRARIEVAENPELSSKVHSLKENLDEHSKQLEQSTEKLSQLESENLNLQDENQASAKGANDVEDNESEPEPDKEALEGAEKTESPMVAYLEQMFSKRLDAMQSMVERLPGVAPPIRKSNPDSYADTPFTDEITLIEMSRKFSFPNIKAYDGTSGLDDHVAQYRQRMLAIALPKESREATMCKGFGSTLTGSALQWYISLPSRSIASFAILSDKFVEQFASSRDLEKTSDGQYEILQHRAKPLRSYIARFNQEKVAIPEGSIPTAISAFKRGLLPDGDLYKELTKYQCKTMEDVLSRAWAQIKWEEDVASRAKAQLKQDPKAVRPDRTDRDEKPSSRPARDSGNRNRSRNQNRPIEKAEGMTMSTWPDISHFSVSRPELINVLRQMGQQDKWPQKMKAPDSDTIKLHLEGFFVLGLCEISSMLKKTYVAWLIFRSSFQKSYDVLLGYIDYVSIHASFTSLIISVDSILVLFFPGELSVTIEIISSSAEFVMSVDRYWDGNVDRWSTGIGR